MNILISGVSGFIGTFLANKLIQNSENYVYGIDMIPSMISARNFVFLSDINIILNPEKFPADTIDTIFHLAQSPDYRDFPQKATSIFKTNIELSFELCEFARKKNVKQFFFTSSGNVYKKYENRLAEESDVCEPTDFYAASKYCAETICSSYRFFFNVRILRLFGVFGPGQKNMLIPSMIEKIRNKTEISLAQNVGLVINPIYIDDLVEIFDTLMNNNSQSEFEVINIAGDEILNYRQMAEIVAEILKTEPNFVQNNMPATYLTGKTEKLKQLTGYLNYTPFRTAIEKIIS